MVYPRQRLYDINHSGYFNAFVSRSINSGKDASFAEAFSKFVDASYPVLPLSRGRLSLYFATRNRVSGNRRDVVMCPFTIFDMINMILCGGGRPKFIDSDPGTPHVSLETIRQQVDENTAMVVITHYHTVNPEIEKIASYLRSRGIALFEDCAISLGGRVNGKHVGSFGDYALFSFGLFKFISTYFGGGALVRDETEREAIATEISGWPRMNAKDLWPYVKKGLKFSTLTSRPVFNLLTFPLFRFGYVNDVDFIKKNAVNDPDPHRKSELPESYKRRPSSFQTSEWVRQLTQVENARQARLDNATLYATRFTGSNVIRNASMVDRKADCYLNYPVNVDGSVEVLKQLMTSGYDASTYFYRNCAELECFDEFHVELPNIDAYARDMIILPTYPGLPADYIRGLSDEIIRIASEMASSSADI
ncbi:MAG: DegT/DnrJ/EryC1/StrS family aminotransferase [Litorimonas sp.]